MPGRPWGNKKDAFGFGDLLVAHREFGVFLIQVTSGSNLSARVHKILDDPKIHGQALQWCLAGGKIALHGWAKKGPRGQKKKWEVNMRYLIHSVVKDRLVEVKLD
jgi:hypothetical protein